MDGWVDGMGKGVVGIWGGGGDPGSLVYSRLTTEHQIYSMISRYDGGV